MKNEDWQRLHTHIQKVMARDKPRCRDRVYTTLLHCNPDDPDDIENTVYFLRKNTRWFQ